MNSYQYDTNQVKALAEATSFRTRKLTLGEFAFVTRILDWRLIRRGPRTEIIERGVAAGVLSADHRLIVSNLNEEERTRLLRAVLDLPRQQQALVEHVRNEPSGHGDGPAGPGGGAEKAASRPLRSAMSSLLGITTRD